MCGFLAKFSFPTTVQYLHHLYFVLFFEHNEVQYNSYIQQSFNLVMRENVEFAQKVYYRSVLRIRIILIRIRIQDVKKFVTDPDPG